MERWSQQAQNVTIVRDDWGIAHIYGKTDADVVFGLMYAQAEDDFNRVETNFINSQGRLAEAEGEAEIYRDLRMKLFINPDSMKARYGRSPEFLKTLMVAWADGLNFYLAKHPEVKPRVLTRFEPWMALTFSEGSIGGDISSVQLGGIQSFYGKQPMTSSTPGDYTPYEEPTGSNGIAISPANTVNKRALFLINPHTSFFFRSEVQLVSEQGLNAYGAVTWGQFFIYQGFNDRLGWMHTTSNVDAVDEYLETVTKRGDRYFYRYGNSERPVSEEKVTVPYKTANGMAKKEFTVYRTHHGPIIREQDGKWVAVRLLEDQIKALTQSFTRLKARNYAEFHATMDLHTNTSNNTIYADADGNIAYFHGNFIPKRDDRLDWKRPVDGSDPATEWGAPLTVEQSPHLLNPASGWLYNTNNAPWSAAGPNSPKKADYPAYVEKGAENPRGVHAIRVLENRKDFTLQRLIDAAYDSYLPYFAEMIPPLLDAYDNAPASDTLKARLTEQIGALRGWDYRWGVNSVPTTLAVYWATDLGRRSARGGRGAAAGTVDSTGGGATPQQRLESLAAATDKLMADFGSWKTPWGQVNRFQRLTGDIVQPFNDAGASIPVGFTSSRWGSLASFGTQTPRGVKKMYGNTGNSFVAAVEFGKDSVRARAVSAGGESGDPKSKHFNDQAERYSTGNLRDVYFYRNQLKGHTEREYHPGS